MLKERIKILKDANVINEDVANYLFKVIDLIDKGEYETSKLEMFTTHLAMATQRIYNHEEVMELDEMIWNQVETSAYFKEANELYETISKLAPVKYPDAEKKFLIMHICNLMAKDGGE